MEASQYGISIQVLLQLYSKRKFMQRLLLVRLFIPSHFMTSIGVAFAPCNKHFYCSVGMDRMVHFHDINSSPTSKGLLQSFQSEFPLLSLSINDDHTVAMGDSKGISLKIESLF